MSWFTGLDMIDAQGLRRDMAVRIMGDHIAEVAAYDGQKGHDLAKDGARALLSPALVDLQVNGGAGRMLGDCTTPAQLSAMAEAHWATGTAAILPTLISDTPEQIRRIVDLIEQTQQSCASVLGLHLEGPHLGVAGAHDAHNLRPMHDADLAFYAEARKRLGVLMITVAPEIVPPAQITSLRDAGVIVALGHTGCDYDMANAAYEAGARMATHLFNAMSGLHHREPGLVGATLDRAMPFGVIADGVHVHPAAIRMALAASPGQAVLVSDAMALTGTSFDQFSISGRSVFRRAGRLELADGTLAGADVTLVAAVENLARWTARDIAELLPMANAAPLALIGRAPPIIAAEQPARLLIWRSGEAKARIAGRSILPLARH